MRIEREGRKELSSTLFFGLVWIEALLAKDREGEEEVSSK